MRTLVAVFFLSASFTAHACKCTFESLPQRVEHAPGAFVAKVLGQTNLEGIVRVAISRVVKGPFTVGEELSLDTMVASDCSPKVAKSAEVLVLAHDLDVRPLRASACAVFLATPIRVSGELVEPSPETLQYLDGLPK